MDTHIGIELKTFAPSQVSNYTNDAFIESASKAQAVIAKANIGLQKCALLDKLAAWSGITSFSLIPVYLISFAAAIITANNVVFIIAMVLLFTMIGSFLIANIFNEVASNYKHHYDNLKKEALLNYG